MAAGPHEQMIRDIKGRFLREVDGGPTNRAAHTAHALMMRRWRSGLDRHGRRMAPYAESTKKQKRREGKPTSPANLVHSGRLASDVSVRSARPTQAYRHRAELYIASSRSRKLIRFHTRGAGRLPKRDPWGLTRREQLAMERRFGAETRRRIPRADRRRSVKVHIGMR